MNDSPRVLGNRYEVGDLLGRGGMAEVHLGRDTRLGRSVAIKLLRTDLARDSTFQARFRREAQSAAALNHPAIVAVYDTGEEPIVESGGGVVSLPYIVMEHVAGRTLRDLLTEHHHLDADFALEITAGVLSALEYSHRIGIVHRDIKPANVMLTPTGDVKVMDFGIARAMADASSTMTQTQAVIGTAQYLSPEQARGEQVDTRSDLYSTGCLLFELLTGRPPFVADSPVAVAYQHVREPAPAPSQFVPGIPESVDRIVLHSLAKGREERYQTAAEFRSDVEAARGGRAVMAAAPSAATTQFVPAPETGATRMLSPAAGGMAGGGLLGQTSAGGYPPAYDTEDDYRRREQGPPPSKRGPIIAGIAVVVIAAIIGFLLIKILGSGDGDPATTNITIPAQVVGQPEQVAITTIKGAGFSKVPTTSSEASPTVAKGKVIRSEPAAGTAQPADTQINLVVSAGTDTVDVPELKGKSVEDAKQELAEKGLIAGSVTEKADFSEDAGVVVGSDPAEGDSVAKGETVTIFVSSSTTKVPDLTDLSLSQARSALSKVDLKLSSNPQYEVTTAAEPNTVIDQSTDPNTTVDRGSSIQVTLAKAPATETTSPVETTDPGDPGDPSSTPSVTVSP